MTDHGIIAEGLFYEGYNCSQSVLLAFEDVTGLDRETAALISSSFGGGLSRMREVCGAVSGGAMVLGLVRGFTLPKTNAEKAAHYHLAQEFAKRFKEDNGSIICRELLQGVERHHSLEPEERTEEYYRKRPCPQIILKAARILDEILKEESSG